jgi:hypothetical protein
MHLFPDYASCEGGDLFFYFKIIKIVVRIKAWGHCSAIDKGAMIFIAAIPIGFKISNKRTRRRKGL